MEKDAKCRMRRHGRPARFRFSKRESVNDSVTDERKQSPSWRKLVTPNLRRANNILVIEESLGRDQYHILDR